NKLKFFAAGQNIFQGDRVVRFWNGFDFVHETDPALMDETHFPIVTTNFDDTLSQGLHMADGNIPFAQNKQWIGSGTLVWDQNPFQVRLGTNISWQNYDQADDLNNYQNLFNSDRIEQLEFSEALVNLKMTHVLNSKTFYEVNVNYFDWRYKMYDPIFEDNFVAYFDSIENAKHGVTFLDWENANVYNEVDIYGFDFDRPGFPSDYQKQKRNYWGGSMNFTTQLENHELKFGGDLQRWTIRQYWLQGTGNRSGEASFFRQMIRNPDQFRNAVNDSAYDVGQFRTAANIANFGYDIFGNEINENVYGFDGPKHPLYGSFYIQDKYEMEQLVVNLGVRLDYIDNDDFKFDDPMNPPWNQNNNSLYADSLQKMDAFIQASPRIGLAFPATDRTVFHVQYGKFVQAPQLSDIYISDMEYNDKFTSGQYDSRVNGIGLKPQKTTSYEVGFNHQFAENASFDITFFYKDIQDWITSTQLVGGALDEISVYNVLINGAFATTKGLEFSMTMRRTNRVAAQVNYTYSSSLGTGSTPLTNIAATEDGTQPPTIISPLDFHRPHVGSINFDYRFGIDDGGPILSQLGLNLLFSFSSGHPYTLREGAFGQQDASVGGMISDTRNRKPVEAINSTLTPWTWDINLRMDKTINFGKFAANFYMYIQNLTNRQNVMNVFMRTGNPYDDGFKQMEIAGSTAAANGGERFWALYDAINLNGNGWNYTNAINQSGNRRTINTLLFGKPRQIRFGVRFEL
ncbi:hypothetical protein JW964_26885, partial [candidate division KSB1 bacterium]|nr:hypothetical protein [candidate division KSB1 bacterium]